MLVSSVPPLLLLSWILVLPELAVADTGAVFVVAVEAEYDSEIVSSFSVVGLNFCRSLVFLSDKEGFKKEECVESLPVNILFSFDLPSRFVSLPS